MPLSNSLESYEDLRPALDRALTSEKGVVVRTPTQGKATHMRQRMYKLRTLERERSLALYEPGDPLRGTCAWDNVQIELGDCCLILRPVPAVIIEDL